MPGGSSVGSAAPAAPGGAGGIGARLGGGMGSLVSANALKHDGGSFFGALFDFSFTTFVTPKIVKVLYILGVLIVALYALVLLVIGLLGLVRGQVGAGLGMIVAAPVVFVLGLCYARVLLEVMVAIFRIAENTSDLSHNTQALLQHQQARAIAQQSASSGSAGKLSVADKI